MVVARPLASAACALGVRQRRCHTAAPADCPLVTSDPHHTTPHPTPPYPTRLRGLQAARRAVALQAEQRLSKQRREELAKKKADDEAALSGVEKKRLEEKKRRKAEAMRVKRI